MPARRAVNEADPRRSPWTESIQRFDCDVPERADGVAAHPSLADGDADLSRSHEADEALWMPSRCSQTCPFRRSLHKTRRSDERHSPLIVRTPVTRPLSGGSRRLAPQCYLYTPCEALAIIDSPAADESDSAQQCEHRDAMQSVGDAK